jgi:hypothetical protein
MDSSTVLVTDFVVGARPAERARTYAILGALLGRLNARPATDLRPGGAWHHLCPQGDPRAEIAAMRELLDSSTHLPDGKAADRLRAEIDEADDCSDLPHGFVHPDFVTVNAVAPDEERLTIVDWAGCGRGPRLWSLGFLLWAAGNRDLRLIEWVVSRYARHVQLEPEELARLEGAIWGRPLMITSWSVARGYRPAARALAEFPADRRKAAEIADRARAAFAA